MARSKKLNPNPTVKINSTTTIISKVVPSLHWIGDIPIVLPYGSTNGFCTRKLFAEIHHYVPMPNIYCLGTPSSIHYPQPETSCPTRTSLSFCHAILMSSNL